MSVNYFLQGVQVFGVQTTWTRKPLRINTDGTIQYSLWVDHTWRIAELEIDIWNALQVLEGKIITNLVTNNIETPNVQSIYADSIFLKMSGTSSGHLMTNVEISLSVKDIVSPQPWYEIDAIPNAFRVAAYQALSASSQEESYVNLILPGTFDLVPNPAPAWDAAIGWTFDDTNLLDTAMTEDLEYSVFIRFADVPIGENGIVFGTQRILLNSHYILFESDATPALATYSYVYNAGARSKILPGDNITDGVIGLFNKTDGNAYGMVIDDQGGELFEVLIKASLTTKFPTANYAWGGFVSSGGSSTPNFTGVIVAAIVYNAPLTDFQVIEIFGALENIE